MTEVANVDSATKSSIPDYYNSGSVEASTDTALIIKRLEAVSFFFYGARFEVRQYLPQSYLLLLRISFIDFLPCQNGTLTEKTADEKLHPIDNCSGRSSGSWEIFCRKEAPRFFGMARKPL